MAEPPQRQQADTSKIPQWMTRYNLPGLSELAYRGGRYRRALSRMLARLPAQSTPGGDGAPDGPPLAALNTGAQQDWTIALVRAWAAVTEVLGFYQERIVNEGYLRTATERRSVLELARTIGYELRPGVAAGALLAFTVLTTREEPSRQVVVPAGTAVQSVPAPGDLPQTFETSAEFAARSEWNALRPAYVRADRWPQTLRREATSARLLGADTGLRPGDTILIVGEARAHLARAQDEAERPWLLATVETVQPFPEAGYTLVTWDVPSGAAGSGPLCNPQAFVMRQQAALFGYTPGGVYCTRKPGSARSPQDSSIAPGTGLGADILSDSARTARSAHSPRLGDVAPGTGHRADGPAHDPDPASRLEHSWAPAAIGLPQTPVRALLGDDQDTLFAATGQGVFRSADGGATWQPLSVSLVQKDVHALALDPDGHLLAGTDDGHIYLSKDGGDQWTALSGEEVVLPPRGLAKLWSRHKTPLPKTAVRALATYSRGRRRTLVAATDEGVFRSRDRGKTWQPANQDLAHSDPKTGLASVVAWALAVSGRNKRAELYAGTDAGVFHIRDRIRFWPVLAVGLVLLCSLLVTHYNPNTGPRIASVTDLVKLLVWLGVWLGLWLGVWLGLWLGVWLSVWLGLRLKCRLSQRAAISLGKPVRALVAGREGQLFAGTEEGLYRSNDGSSGERMGRQLARFLLGDLARRWQRIDANLAGRDVRALAVGARGDLLAGTGDGSVFRSCDNGDTWEPLGTVPSRKPIQAVWATADRAFAAGLPAESPVESDWSPFQVEQKQIDLHQVVPELSPGSWVVLRDGRGTPATLYRVTQVEVADSRDPARPGRFSRMAVDRSDGLDGFDRGTALALVQSEPLGLLCDRPLGQDALTFDRSVPGLEPGHKLIVSGKRLRARLLSRAAEGLQLVSDDGLRSVDMEAGETYPVLGVREGSTPGTQEWRLRTGTGFVGSVTATEEQIGLEPAADGDEIVSEVTEIRSVDAGPEQTRIVLRSPLGNCLDRTTATVYGNVVHATHGQTVADEPLDSSEGLAAHQRFLLKQRPLTYTRAATGRGVESTVQIEINGVRWQEVTSFDRLDREKRKFVLRQDDQGNTAVLFGHGAQGSGLPSSTAQVTARYRKGLGYEGNVAAGSLHLLQTAVPGLKGVTNPLAAAGGADPERMDTAREKAPLSVRATQRIVSLGDYADFCRQFAGIDKAQATLLSTGSRQVLHITVADAAGNEVAEGSDLYLNLVAAIHSARACPVPAVHVASFQRAFFCLKARLWIAPDHQPRTAEIERAARRALEDAFAFERREFGQPVAAAQVIALIQGIPGVRAVELGRLHRHGQEPKRNLLLEAQCARWEGDQLRPAEMLVLKPLDGIELELESAP